MEIEKQSDSGARSRSQSWSMDELYVSATDGSKRSSHADADEEALKLASLHKLPTFDRLRTAFLASYNTDDIKNQDGDHHKNKQVNVRELGANDQQQIINKLFKVAEAEVAVGAANGDDVGDAAVVVGESGWWLRIDGFCL
ncbi:hypothetical protein Tco_1400743 [Tanacetum coccineum]